MESHLFSMLPVSSSVMGPRTMEAHAEADDTLITSFSNVLFQLPTPGLLLFAPFPFFGASDLGVMENFPTQYH